MNFFLNPENHLLVLARQGQRLTHLAVVVPFGFMIPFIGQFGGLFLLILFLFLLGINPLEWLASGLSFAELSLAQGAMVQTLLLILLFTPFLVAPYQYKCTYDGCD